MIRFDSVTMTYNGQSKPALDDVTVEILRGEFVFLVGASGSGKSSFLRLILKEERPTTGQIHVLGQDLRRISSRKIPYFRRNLGVVFQDFRLLPNKNVFDNVAFALRVIGKSRGFIQTAVPETLRLVGLDGKGKRLPHELSGGEQQRVAIARAIVNKPQILLADEPTGNLDPVTSAGIMTLLERINAGGTTVIMATHEAGIVDQMQRRVIELSAGEVVRDERSAGYGISAEAIAVEVEATDAAAAASSVVPTPEPAVTKGRGRRPSRKSATRKGAAPVPAETPAAQVEPAATAAQPSESAAATAATAAAAAAAVAAARKSRAEAATAKAAGTETAEAEAKAAKPSPGRATKKTSPAKPATADDVLHDASGFDSASHDVPATGEDADAVVAALREEESAAAPSAPKAKRAAPKVTAEVMRDAPPLYVEPEATDEVTDEAAAITAAATAPIERVPAQGGDDAEADAPPGRPAPPGSAKKSANLTLAERLGLRSPAGPRPGDDDQEVGPVK
ncbi:cell division ATP-binding protein FtsE [Agromyces sp. NPDC056523]|uniref:cell division ATP-binding protein FtsE n=1 Tax=Agromyces sp. NPDC056523 TaxID=3345850 RepID=UPI00366B2FC6